MSRRLSHLIAATAVAVALGGINAAVAGAEEGCVDHIDHGVGNVFGEAGDPGNGGQHGNEDNGIGNGGDPGNGQGHFCTTE